MADDEDSRELAAAARESDKDAQLIGHVTMIWNMAQHAVFVLFQAVSELPSDAAQAVFFTIRQDSAQRDVTLALCEAVLIKDDADILAAIRNAITRLNKLSGERNAAVHTIWNVSEIKERGFLRPNPSIRFHSKKLGPDVRRQFQDLYTELARLTVDIGSATVSYQKRLTSRYTTLLQEYGQAANGSAGDPPDTNTGTPAPPPSSRE